MGACRSHSPLATSVSACVCGNLGDMLTPCQPPDSGKECRDGQSQFGAGGKGKDETRFWGHMLLQDVKSGEGREVMLWDED